MVGCDQRSHLVLRIYPDGHEIGVSNGASRKHVCHGAVHVHLSFKTNGNKG